MTPGRFKNWQVTLEQAIAVCRRHGLPEPIAVSRVPRGEVSGVFYLDLADGQCAVLKVYLRSASPRWLVAEQALFEHLRLHSNLPVPAWTFLELDTELLGWPYALQERLIGVDGEQLRDRLAMHDSDRLIRKSGELLARLHRVPTSGEALRIAQVSGPEQWAGWLDEEFQEAVARLDQQGWLDVRLLQRARQVWAAGRSVREAPFEPVLCHGDYQLWNLLFDPSSLHPTALLDIGQAYLGPPAADFRDLELNVFDELPRLRRAFLRGYGWTDFDERERARLRLAALSRALALMAAYWGPTAKVTPATVWHLLAPWSEGADD